jgi:hypothetical protein
LGLTIADWWLGPQSPIANRQSPIANRQSPIVNPSIDNRQSTNRQSPVGNPPIGNRQSTIGNQRAATQ